jgi:hypothetical protein
VKTTRGKNLPLNLDPSDSPVEGNFGLNADRVAFYVRDAARMSAFRLDGSCEVPIYIAHFATCPGR